MQQFIKEKGVQIFQSTLNRCINILLTHNAVNDFIALKQEMRYVFSKTHTLSNQLYKENWVMFINKTLISAAKHIYLYLNIYSLGKNNITSLLKLPFVQKVASTMAHIDIKSTMA